MHHKLQLRIARPPQSDSGSATAEASFRLRWQTSSLILAQGPCWLFADGEGIPTHGGILTTLLQVEWLPPEVFPIGTLTGVKLMP